MQQPPEIKLEIEVFNLGYTLFKKENPNADWERATEEVKGVYRKMALISLNQDSHNSQGGVSEL
ncbi:MAG: hypothetical protein ABL903_04215 [Methylococcales bacterium]